MCACDVTRGQLSTARRVRMKVTRWNGKGKKRKTMKEKDECSIIRELTIRRRRRECVSEIDDVCALLALAMIGFTTALTRTGEGEEEGDEEGTTRKGDGSNERENKRDEDLI